MAADQPLPYDRPTDPGKRHSHALTDGPDRAGARSMLKAVGFTDDDLAQPIVGVATSWIETMPCNLNQRRLAESRQGGHPGGRRDADGVQHDRRLRRRVDGHRGHEGVADQPRGHRGLDRARRPRPPVRRHRVPRRLRQDDPGRARWPSGRLGIPGLDPVQRHDLPGHATRAQPADIVTVYEAIGVVPRRQDHASRSCTRSRRARAPAPARAAASSRPTRWRRCASSWACRPRGLNGIPAEDPSEGGRGAPGRRAGDDARPPRHPPGRHRHPQLARERDRVGLRDRRQHQRRAPPAGDRRRVRDDADPRRVHRGRRPDAAHRRHAPRRPVRRGGHVRRRRRRASSCASCSRRDLLHGEETTVDGRTIAKIAADTVETPGQPVVRTIDNPIKATGGITILQAAASRPTGASSSSRAPSGASTAGRRACSTPRPRASRPSAERRIVAGDVVVIRYEGPVGGPGMQEMLGRDRRARRRGARRVRRAADRRPVLRRHARPDDRPRLARRRRWAGPIALIEEGDIVSVDVDAKELNLEVPDDVLAERRARWTPPAAALHDRRPGEVRGARLVGGRGRGHQRRAPARRARARGRTASGR